MDSSPNSVAVDLVSGRYRLGEVIGRGGMASVYTAKDLNLGRDVALKLFAPQSADPDELRRQEAEIELLATLNHPSLVTLFDAGIDTPDPRRAPALPDHGVGGRPGPPDPDPAQPPPPERTGRRRSRRGRRAGLRPCAWASSTGTSSRPTSCWCRYAPVSRCGRSSRTSASPGSWTAPGSQRPGTMVGTAAYLSPEQARGADLGPASDIYSLGLVMLECLKGEVEFPGSAVESAVARLHRAPVHPGLCPGRMGTAVPVHDRPGSGGPLRQPRTWKVPCARPSSRPSRCPACWPRNAPGVLPAPPAGLRGCRCRRSTRPERAPSPSWTRTPRHSPRAGYSPDGDGLPRKPDGSPLPARAQAHPDRHYSRPYLLSWQCWRWPRPRFPRSRRRRHPPSSPIRP